MPRSLPLLAAAVLACASAPTPPPPPPPPVVVAPPPPPPSEAVRLAAAARFLADGVELEQAQALLDGIGPGDPRRDQLLGQLAELRGDDQAAEAAYSRALAKVDDDDVRLRRALALERLGRGAEVKEDLARLRPAAEAKPHEVAAKRKLRPLLPSSR
ncbi:MAG TPA: hypothetical protein VFP50_03300 [Anaeromyxobacteraceae bacterium]|nr:hypothetical protein [Anaeromyxobacteraceae bacterium]